jgi:hypothetical protein
MQMNTQIMHTQVCCVSPRYHVHMPCILVQCILSLYALIAQTNLYAVLCIVHIHNALSLHTHSKLLTDSMNLRLLDTLANTHNHFYTIYCTASTAVQRVLHVLLHSTITANLFDKP